MPRCAERFEPTLVPMTRATIAGTALHANATGRCHQIRSNHLELKMETTPGSASWLSVLDVALVNRLDSARQNVDLFLKQRQCLQNCREVRRFSIEHIPHFLIVAEKRRYLVRWRTQPE